MAKFSKPTCLVRLLTSVSSANWSGTIGLRTAQALLITPMSCCALGSTLDPQPAIDVGSAMTAKILQHNDKVVCWSTYRTLTVEERANNTVQQDMITFRELLKST